MTVKVGQEDHLEGFEDPVGECDLAQPRCLAEALGPAGEEAAERPGEEGRGVGGMVPEAGHQPLYLGDVVSSSPDLVSLIERFKLEDLRPVNGKFVPTIPVGVKNKTCATRNSGVGHILSC